MMSLCSLLSYLCVLPSFFKNVIISLRQFYLQLHHAACSGRLVQVSAVYECRKTTGVQLLESVPHVRNRRLRNVRKYELFWFIFSNFPHAASVLRVNWNTERQPIRLKGADIRAIFCLNMGGSNGKPNQNFGMEIAGSCPFQYQDSPCGRRSE